MSKRRHIDRIDERGMYKNDHKAQRRLREQFRINNDIPILAPFVPLQRSPANSAPGERSFFSKMVDMAKKVSSKIISVFTDQNPDLIVRYGQEPDAVAQDIEAPFTFPRMEHNQEGIFPVLNEQAEMRENERAIKERNQQIRHRGTHPPQIRRQPRDIPIHPLDMIDIKKRKATPNYVIDVPSKRKPRASSYQIDQVPNVYQPKFYEALKRISDMSRGGEMQHTQNNQELNAMTEGQDKEKKRKKKKDAQRKKQLETEDRQRQRGIQKEFFRSQERSEDELDNCPSSASIFYSQIKKVQKQQRLRKAERYAKEQKQQEQEYLKEKERRQKTKTALYASISYQGSNIPIKQPDCQPESYQSNKGIPVKDKKEKSQVIDNALVPNKPKQVPKPAIEIVQSKASVTTKAPEKKEEKRQKSQEIIKPVTEKTNQTSLFEGLSQQTIEKNQSSKFGGVFSSPVTNKDKSLTLTTPVFGGLFNKSSGENTSSNSLFGGVFKSAVEKKEQVQTSLFGGLTKSVAIKDNNKIQQAPLLTNLFNKPTTQKNNYTSLFGQLPKSSITIQKASQTQLSKRLAPVENKESTSLFGGFSKSIFTQNKTENKIIVDEKKNLFNNIVTEENPQPIPKSVTKIDTKPVPEPISKSAFDPVFEPVKEPVIEPTPSFFTSSPQPKQPEPAIPSPIKKPSLSYVKPEITQPSPLASNPFQGFFSNVQKPALSSLFSNLPANTQTSVQPAPSPPTLSIPLFAPKPVAPIQEPIQSPSPPSTPNFPTLNMNQSTPSNPTPLFPNFFNQPQPQQNPTPSFFKKSSILDTVTIPEVSVSKYPSVNSQTPLPPIQITLPQNSSNNPFAQAASNNYSAVKLPSDTLQTIFGMNNNPNSSNLGFYANYKPQQQQLEQQRLVYQNQSQQSGFNPFHKRQSQMMAEEHSLPSQHQNFDHMFNKSNSYQMQVQPQQQINGNSFFNNFNQPQTQSQHQGFNFGNNNNMNTNNSFSQYQQQPQFNQFQQQQNSQSSFFQPEQNSFNFTQPQFQSTGFNQQQQFPQQQFNQQQQFYQSQQQFNPQLPQQGFNMNTNTMNNNGFFSSQQKSNQSMPKEPMLVNPLNFFTGMNNISSQKAMGLFQTNKGSKSGIFMTNDQKLAKIQRDKNRAFK